MKFLLGRHGAAVEARLQGLIAEEAAERIWRRDATFWGGDRARQESVANRLGWLDVAEWMLARTDELEEFARHLVADGYRDAVVLGMGGSSLAPEVLRRSFGASPALRLHILDTTDPVTIRSVQVQIDVQHTLFFVSSKSGSTIEVLSLFEHFHMLVSQSKVGAAGENFVAITDEGTSLQQLAREHGFRHIFTNPGDIGGRYSALSYFGMAPAAVAGIDVRALLDRGIAAASDAHAQASDALRLGAALGELAAAGRDKCTFVISPAIASFGLWLEQLIAESTGKEGRGIVPVAGEPLGTPKQYGDDRVFVQVRLDADSSGEEDAAIAAMVAEGHPAIVIDCDDVHDLGREFFRWEFATAVAGRVLGINPFDEPNVQESKDNTNRVLREFESSGKLDADGISEAERMLALTTPGVVDDEPVEIRLRTLLSALDEHGYFATTAYIEQTEVADAAFADIRSAVRNEERVATTLGYGPRFLHSTGQFHKGGPPVGVFLQITAGDSVDIPVPGKPYSFGQLKRAQSIGDFQSLLSHGRPVLRIHLGVDVDQSLHDLGSALRAAVATPQAARR